MNSKQQTTSSVTEDISEHLNLNNLVAGKHKSLLKALTCSYYEEKIAGINPKYPKIILLGPTGKEANAIATHNSISNLNFVHLESDFLNKGGDDIIEILKSCSEYDTIYISNASKLSPYVQNILWKYLKFGKVDIVIDVFERRKEVIKVPDVLLILGTTTLQGISPGVHKQFIHCHLLPYNNKELVLILEQYCTYYGILYTSEKVFEMIAEHGGQRARTSLELLELSRKYMLAAEGKEKISLLHVNRALASYSFVSNTK